MNYYIYVLQNKINNKIYIGKTNNPNKRIQWHKDISNMSDNYANCSLIHRAIRKYGFSNFTSCVIEEFDCETSCLDAEKFWIEFFRTNVCRYGDQYGYNLTDGGDGVSGFKHSQEAKEKVSKKNKGRVLSLETRIRMSNGHKGKPSPMLGKSHSKETKQKLSSYVKGENNYFFGKSFVGDNHPTAKLNDAKVKEIIVLLKENTISQKEIAKLYNVSLPTINKIYLNKTWKHIER